jgi:hypothetical protein
MRSITFLRASLVALLLNSLTALAQADLSGGLESNPVTLSELSTLDQQYMRSQRNLIEDLARRKLGSAFSGEPSRDIATLQRLLDERVVEPHQRQELQAMGIILGDLLAVQLDMRWIIYEDSLGRSRALQLKDTDNFLFPVTMISRRREVGNNTPVQAIFDKAVATIEPLIPPRPFE